MNLRSRARRLFGREEKLSENTVHASRIDHAVLRDVRRRAGAIEEEVQAPPELPGGEKLNGRVWEKLAEDLFSSYYGDDSPELVAHDKIDPACMVNRALADKTSRGEGFAETRTMTRGEVMESAIALRGALRSMRGSYGKELAEHGERQNEIADQQDSLEDIDSELERLRQERASADAAGMTGDLEAYDDRIREVAREKRSTVDALKQAEAEQAKHAGDLIDAARSAAAKAGKAAEGSVLALSSLPGDQTGPGSKIGVDAALALAERVQGSPVLRQVLELLGRLELSIGQTRRQMRRGGYEEMTDIELGDDLRLVLPAERALLTHPVARLDFYRRFHERSLTQYEMWSEGELKKGPIIFAADGSGSMSGAPNVFARALTLAAIAIGNRERRNTAALEFGAAGQLAEFLFPAGQPLDVALALAFAEHFYGGGTRIKQVLARAAELIREEQPFASADLVILTDGRDTLDAETIRLRDELRADGVRVHGLQIAGRPSPWLIEVCDDVTPVWEFTKPNSASDRLAINLT